MAALDFPASPTVGATYTAPNGVIYQWDGATWQVTGPASGQAAGGVLTGFYPNPQLAIGVSVRQFTFVAIPATTNINSVNVWADVKTLSITTVGGIVLLLAMPAWYGQAPVNAAIYVSTGLARDQTIANIVALSHQINVQGTGGQLVGVPLPPIIAVDNPAAGAHVYHLVAAVPNSNCYVATAAQNPGTFWAIELA